MQRGKDGVIYIRKNENLITGILFPNKIGEKCEYRDSLYWHESRAVNFSELHNLVVIPDMPSQTDSLLLPQDTQLCQNTTLQLEVKAQGESYLWQDGSTTPNYELSQAGTYWVEVQKGNCTFTDTIVVLPDESAIALGSDTMLCQGDEITLNLSESKDLEWQDGSKTPSFTVRESGIYWVESKDSLCRFRDSIHITYKAAALNLGADRVICPNDSAILLTTALSSNEVRWQDGSINNDFTAREAGLYWAETINRECPEKDSIVIRVEAAIPFLPKDTIICGETVYLVKPEITNDSLFWWASGAIGKEIAIDSTGVYMATIYKNNCSWTDSLRVDFIKNIGINLPADTSLCKGNTLSLDYSDKEGVLNWQDGSTNPNYEIKEAGLYWLEQRKGSCSSRDSMRVFFESLSIDLGADTSICEGNVLEIDLSQANGNYYLWQDGLNSAQRILTEAGLYSVEVGTDVCIAKDSFVLEIETCATEQACQIYIPNAFSPNSDGINDYLELQSNCELFDYKLQVFDRWGNRVYESADPIAFWDGKYHNEHLDNGVYLVYIACRFEGEKRMENRVETVTVFR
jgi:gliding motility-associated-like protein